MTCGLDSKIGSLTPGNKADLITLRASDPDLWSANPMVRTLIGSATTRSRWARATSD